MGVTPYSYDKVGWHLWKKKCFFGILIQYGSQLTRRMKIKTLINYDKSRI